MPTLSERLDAARRALVGRGRVPEQPLSERLAAVGTLVPEDAVLADIGTDHAWLPIHLVHARKVQRAIAADKRTGPLEGARARVAAHRLSDHIELRLGDGMTVLAPGDATAVTIAGMGGRRIVDIVTAGVLVATQLERLVVQPNTDVPFVRTRLRQLGLRLVDERLLFEGGHWYTVMAWTPGTTDTVWDDADVRFGPILRRRADPALRRFLGSELSRVAQVLARARGQGAKAASLSGLSDELAAIEQELARLALVKGGITKG